jgi:hypothetical protein
VQILSKPEHRARHVEHVFPLSDVVLGCPNHHVRDPFVVHELPGRDVWHIDANALWLVVVAAVSGCVVEE